MDYIDESSRPRFQIQSRAISPAPHPHPQTLLQIPPLPAAVCFLAAALLLPLAFLLSAHTLPSLLLLHLSLSLLLGPFAPPHLTFGSPRVGRGPPLPPPPLPRSPSPPRSRSRPAKSHHNPTPLPDPVPIVKNHIQHADTVPSPSPSPSPSPDWTEGDFELLKKLMGKYPVGVAGRWEKMAEGFNGRHGVESVIRMGKDLSDKRAGTGDSYSEFLKQRKPMDKRAEDQINGTESSDSMEGWSAGEDKALLNALKVFPKEVALRWEKVAAAVPGKTKAGCMKRVAELKRDFRSSKV